MDNPKATPKDFFLWAGAMLALYAGVVAFISLIFTYIDYVFPSTLNYYGDPYASAAYEMAALIVLAPVLLILMRVIRGDIARDSSRQDIWVRRWALYLTVFVAGATIVIDLITLIYTFLSGEDLTARFLLKVLIVLLVAAAGFIHFYADIKGYWAQQPKRAKTVNWSVAVVVLASIAAGFFIIGTPGDARGYRQDEQKVIDLQTIQWQLVTFWQQKEALPASLDELNDPISGFILPVDPQSGEQYRYERTSAVSFRLCAAFNAEDRYVEPTYARSVTTIPAGEKSGGDTWEHGAGEVCFDRTIDPERYPPYRITR